MTLVTIGHRLRNIRKSLGISRKELEIKHNVSANTIKVWESGKVGIGIIKLLNYLEIFKKYSIYINLNDLLDLSKPSYLDRSLIIDKYNLLRLQNQKNLQLISNVTSETTNLLLENNTSMLDALFDYIPVNIIIKDELNNIVKLNHSAAKKMNGTIDDFQSKNMYDIFPQMGHAYHESDRKALETKIPITIVEEVVNKNQPNTTIIVNKTPIIRENQRLVIVVFKCNSYDLI